MDSFPGPSCRLCRADAHNLCHFWDVGSNIRAKGYGKVATLPAKAQLHNNDARPAMFDYVLSVTTTAQFKKLVRYGNDAHARAPPQKGTEPTEADSIQHASDILRFRFS